MNESILQYKERLTQYWKQASKVQKYMILGTIVFLIAVLILTSINLSKTVYSPAFTNLQPNDAASIKGYLDGLKIPYELSTDGKNISVPASRAASIKLDVESQGLNKSGSLGYAGTFGANSMFGMSDNEFQVKLVSAMQGEIQQMFSQINGVASSKVLITVPKDTAFFTTGNQDSTASVLLNIQPGYRFDQAQIDTMYNLVSKTVRNLKYDNITISNQNGEALPYSKSTGATIGSGDLVTQQMQIQNLLQTNMQKNVMNLLNVILGPNRAVVSVLPTLNFDKKNEVRNTVTPVLTDDGTGIKLSEQSTSKTSTTTGAASAGVPGTGNTDVPTYQGNNPAGGNNKSEETSSIINWEVNRIKSEIVSSPYIVRDMSINVGIDNSKEITQEMKDNVQKALVSIVQTSLADSGQNLNDDALAKRVTLFVQPFANLNGNAANGVNNYYLYGGIGAAALILAALGGYLMRRRKQNEIIEEEIPAPVVVELPTIDMENASPENQMRKQLESLAKKKPEDFVNLLRTWLVDE